MYDCRIYNPAYCTMYVPDYPSDFEVLKKEFSEFMEKKRKEVVNKIKSTTKNVINKVSETFSNMMENKEEQEIVEPKVTIEAVDEGTNLHLLPAFTTWDNVNEFNMQLAKNDPRTVFDPACCHKMETIHRMTPEEKETVMKEKEEYLKNFKPTIEQAIMHYQMGVKSAFDFVYNHYKSKIFNFAKSKTKNDLDRDDLEDLILEQFVICANKYNGGSQFNTYFWSCAQRNVKMFFDKKNAKKRRSEDGMPDVHLYCKLGDSDTQLVDTIKDNNGETDMKRVLYREIISSRIKPNLNEKENEIIDLLLKGYDIAHINKVLNITRAGVYNRISKIKEKVANMLSRQEMKEILCAY